MTTIDTEPRPLLTRALDQAGTLIAGTDPADAQLPTPCPDYDVATLISHLQAVVRRIGAVLSGQPFFSVPVLWPTTDWAADWAAGRAETDAVLADDTNLARTVRVPWGEVPGSVAAASYVGELATHAWDLAAATGRRDQLDEELAIVALPSQQAKLPAEPRGGDIPFGPVVPVPADAPAYDRLVGWSGRDPGWQPGA